MNKEGYISTFIPLLSAGFVMPGTSKHVCMSVLHAAILQLHLYDGGSRKKEGSPHIYPFVYWLKQDVQGVSSPLLDLSTVLYFGFIFSLPCSSRF